MVLCPNIWLHVEGLYLGCKLRETCMNRSGAADLKPDLFPTLRAWRRSLPTWSPAASSQALSSWSLPCGATSSARNQEMGMRSQYLGDQVDLPARGTICLFLSPSVHSRWLLGPLIALPSPLSIHPLIQFPTFFSFLFFKQRSFPTPHYPSCTKAM